MVHIMKTMEQFWSEISTNEELAEKLEQIASEQELEALLKENEGVTPNATLWPDVADVTRAEGCRAVNAGS